MSANSKSSKSLSDVAAMPQFAAPTIEIAPEVLSMIKMDIDPALVEAAEVKEVRLDEIKAKKDEAKRLLAQAHELAKTLNPLCDEQDRVEQERKDIRAVRDAALLKIRIEIENHPDVLAEKMLVLKAAKNRMSEFLEKVTAAIAYQANVAQAENTARLKELDASFAELDKKTAQLSKQYDEYKALSARLFTEADSLKAEYGL